MHRLGLCLVVVMTGCFAEDRPFLCVGADCDVTEPSNPPPPPPIQFVFDRGTQQSVGRIALDGVMELRVQGPGSQLQTVVAAGDAIDMAITSSVPGRTELEVTGTATGTGTITATVPTVDQPAVLGLPVAELASIGVSFDFQAPTDRLVVLPETHQVGVRLTATDGEPVLDHSLAIDASSDPGFTLTGWDVLGLPATPGEHVLALTRRAGDLHHVSIRVVDQIDAIVPDRVDTGKPFGDLCVHAEVDGEPVSTFAWQFQGTNLVLSTQLGHCISFYDAVAGATITVEIAGTTKDFVIVPAVTTGGT